MFKWMSRCFFGIGVVVTGLTVTACGAPNFGAMKPTAYKPSALGLLVDGPTHWQQSDVTGLANSIPNLVIKAQSTTSAHLVESLNEAMKIQGLGVLVVIFPSAIPTSAVQFAKSHGNVRFEFIGTSPASESAYNVRQVVSDKLAVAYATGWLAGKMAAQSNVHSIGFVPAVAPGPTTEVQAMLAGVYDADPTVQLVPVIPTGAPALSIPAVDVSSGAIAPSDLKALQTRQAFFASLDFGNQSVTGMSLPVTTHLEDDLRAFVRGKWQSGVETTIDAPVLLYNSGQVPQSVQTALVAEVNIMVSDKSVYQAAWKAVPKNIQSQWNGIAGS